MKLCLLALSLISLSSCCSKKEMTAQTLKSNAADFVVLINDSNINITEEKSMIIDNQESLKAFYKRMNATRSPGLEMPVVDFKNQSIIVVSMGQKSSGGYFFLNPEVQKGIFTKYMISTQSPGPKDIVTMSMTTPGLVILANQKASDVRIEMVPVSVKNK